MGLLQKTLGDLQGDLECVILVKNYPAFRALFHRFLNIPFSSEAFGFPGTVVESPVAM